MPDASTKTEKEAYSEIIEKNEDRQIIKTSILTPGVPDREGDILAADNIENVAFDFMENHQRVDEMHDEIERPEHSIVESYIAPEEFELGDSTVRKGSWVLSLKLGDDAWQSVKDGTYTGLSIGGTGERYPEQGGGN